MAEKLSTIINAIATRLEQIVPDVRSNVPFKRWTDAKPLEQASIELRERAFQIRLGKTLQPRTMSSLSVQWQRAELLVVVGYNFTEPRQNDAVLYNVGIHTQPFIDHRQLVNALVYGNALSGIDGVLRLLFLDAETPTDTARTWRFDLEWSEVFDA